MDPVEEARSILKNPYSFDPEYVCAFATVVSYDSAPIGEENINERFKLALELISNFLKNPKTLALPLKKDKTEKKAVVLREKPELIAEEAVGQEAEAKADYKKKATPPPEPTQPDFYNILGVDRFASKDDIKRAYRDRLLKQKLHPDYIEIERREGKISEEEYKQRTREAQDINLAFLTLMKDEDREKYNKYWDKTYVREKPSGTPGLTKQKDMPPEKPALEPPPTTPAEPAIPYTPSLTGDKRKSYLAEPSQKETVKDTTTSLNLAITFVPTVVERKDKRFKSVKSAKRRSQELIKDVALAGLVNFSPEELGQLKASGLLPENLRNEAVNSAIATGVSLFAKGAKSEKYLKQVQAVEGRLSKGQAQYLNLSGFVLESLEKQYARASNLVYFANQEPELEIHQVTTLPAPQPNLMPLQGGGVDIFQPIFEKTAGKLADITGATTKIKGMVNKALEVGGKKLVKQGASKFATKAGISLALKAGLKLVPGIGWASLALDVLSFLKRKVAGFLSGLTRWLFGEEDRQKRRAIIALGLAALLFYLGQLLPFLAAALTIAALSALVISVGYAAAHVGGAQIAGAGKAAIYGVTTVIVPSVALPTLLAIILVPLITAIILFIINTSAFLVPPHTLIIPYAVTNPYIEITKTLISTDPAKCRLINPNSLKCNNNELPITVEYQINIRATSATLTNIRFTNTCNVSRDGAVPSCNHPTPSAPSLISPTSPFSFTYTQTYSSGFRDALVADTFTITADAEAEGVAGTTAAASASVCIGDCPQECPSGWPTTSGYLTQGAYALGCSHSRMEAIDIGIGVGAPVYATHAGIATRLYNNCLGNYVEIRSSCNGIEFISEYSHLTTISINSGQAVAPGQPVGTSGGAIGTSTCTSGPHLHYRFKYPGGGNPSYPSNPPYMWQTYLPANVPRGCCTIASCGITI